jgi:protein gp37
MGDKTGIEWTDATWNPLVGCSIKSAGCAHCYAILQAARLERMGVAHYAGLTERTKGGQTLWTGIVREAPESILLKPLAWKRPRKIFVNSMSDLFHETVPFETIDRIFAVMAAAPQHTFQVLTKRPERMLEYARSAMGCGEHWLAHVERSHAPMFPLANVWLGTTVENQAAADERIPLLLQTPAAVRWLSVEPMIGPVEPWTEAIAASAGRATQAGGIDWVVCGGESGPGARPMHPNWARTLRDRCEAALVPFLFKQWGDWAQATGTKEGDVILRAPHPLYPGDEAVVSIGTTMRRIGKHKAGRVLDGVTHDGYPA